jgi:anti-anti-sigma factor
VQNHIGLNGITKMGIQNLSKKVLFVDLPSNALQIENELKNLNETVSTRSDCDVVIDFFRVEIITSSSISNLMILHKLMQEHERQLILCNVAITTKYIFTVTGLDKVFDFVDDRSAAMSAVQCAEQPKSRKGCPTAEK